MTAHTRNLVARHGWLFAALALAVASIVSVATIGWFAPLLFGALACIAATVWAVRLNGVSRIS